MRTVHSLSDLSWLLVGVAPTQWEAMKERDVGSILEADIGPVPARVPGSVQGALRAAGILPDWNEGVNHRNVRSDIIMDHRCCSMIVQYGGKS
jgi:hypothetical protein